MEPLAVRLRPFEEGALERAGLRREGCVRGHHFRNSRWRDGYLYGITRDDWRR